MYCKYCGKELPENSKFCSYCGRNLNDTQTEQEKSSQETDFNSAAQSENVYQVVNAANDNQPKSKKSKKRILKWVIIIIAVVCLISLIGLLSDTVDVGDSEETTSTTETTVTEAEKKESHQQIYEDDIIKVEYIDCYDEDDIEGCSYLALKIENKADKTVMISLDEASVNDMMVNTGGAMTIKPDKSSQTPFILFTGVQGIESADDIETMAFKIIVLDNDTMETIEETAEIRGSKLNN